MLKKSKADIPDVVVIGGGPAGLMAAGTAGKFGAKVTLFEKNEIMGKKLLISGGGRCNMTNGEPDERVLLSKFGKKGNFLFTPFSVFGNDDAIRFFENLGVKTKVENNFRVFPVSDKSADVLEALTKSAKDNGVEFIIGFGVSHMKVLKNKIQSLILENGEEVKAKCFVLAAGGKSHPETGSTGDGFKWLKSIGHKIAAANPSLVPIKTKEEWVKELAGITLADVGVSLWQDNKKVVGKKGRILFTHDGLSGPTIINMSKMIADLLEGTEYEGSSPEKILSDGKSKIFRALDKESNASDKTLAGKEVKVAIDFFPGVGLDVIHENIRNIFEQNPRKMIKNLVFKEVPEKVYLKMLKLMGMDGEWFANEVRRPERFMIVDKFKKFEFTVDRLLGYDKAIISSGGVDLAEVDFKEMKSKLFDNLFLVGDILDFDRPSGGYSLQLCWTTGYVAGKLAAKNSKEN